MTTQGSNPLCLQGEIQATAKDWRDMSCHVHLRRPLSPCWFFKLKVWNGKHPPQKSYTSMGIDPIERSTFRGDFPITALDSCKPVTPSLSLKPLDKSTKAGKFTSQNINKDKISSNKISSYFVIVLTFLLDFLLLIFDSSTPGNSLHMRLIFDLNLFFTIICDVSKLIANIW